MQLDVVTTAIRRPELLALTYASFFSRLVGLPSLRIVINVDPLGLGDVKACIEIASRYGDVVMRSPSEPSFAASVNWCWEQLESDYFLYLEDDWLLTRTINYQDWLNSFRDSGVDQSVLIMKHPRVRPLAYSFRPHLGRRDSVRACLPIPSSVNPEKFIGQHPRGLSSVDYGESRTLLDMGRKWAKGEGLERTEGSSSWFKPRHAQPWNQLEYQLYRAIWRLRTVGCDFK